MSVITTPVVQVFPPSVDLAANVCGLTTAVCVTQTARETADRGFRVVVAEDACTEMSIELHKAALLAFGWVFGRVRPTADIVNFFTAAARVAV